jgi:hypothetical protein
MERLGIRVSVILFAVFALVVVVMPSAAQQEQASGSILERAASIEVSPTELTIEVGGTATLTATVKDADGNVIPAPVVYITRSRRNVGVNAEGLVEAYQPGEYVVAVMVPGQGGGRGRGGRGLRGRGGNPGLSVDVSVTIPQPPLERIEVSGIPERLYTRSLLRGTVEVYDASDTLRPDAAVTFASSDPTIVGIDRFGQVMPLSTGSAILTLTAAEVTHELSVRVVDNPAVSLEVAADQTEARTGDVIHLTALAKDARGNVIEDMPVLYSIQTHPSLTNPGAPASGQVAQDGRFVAELPGQYTIVANAGGLLGTATIEIEPRNVSRQVEVVGRAPVRDRHTSDLWIWEGQDGRDYAITGTWGAEGHAYFWDVTNPENMVLVDTVLVDARTINDVKISEDGTIAVISREGASNRRNGIVILDVSNPSEVTKLSEFDEELTGGVHNVFIHDNHVYAVNNGRRFDIINIAEPKLPFRVSRFELEVPGHSIHDVWVDDGIAYSSNWRDGVVLIDVGNGVAGGTPENPVQIGSYADPKGRNHAAFPFRSQSTDKFYVIMGDETFPYGMNSNGPSIAGGYMHIVDFTDPDNPVEVARFEVPEAGTHNLWIEDDVMYAAFYNGGVRVVDLSGELMGDLYKQGREIAWFYPNDEDGFVSNAPMTWGAHPYKGLIYFSDFNSGLWAIRLVEEGESSQD